MIMKRLFSLIISMGINVKPYLFIYILFNSLFLNYCGYKFGSPDFYKAILQNYGANWLIGGDLQTDNVTCCADGQWEANAFLLFGSVIDIPKTNSYFYYNGTGNIVVDDVRRKSYVSFNITAYSPQVPIYSNFTTTTIKDFRKGIMYQIDDDGNCMKQTIAKSMRVLCIPGMSRRIAVGQIAGTENVLTYQFTTSSRVTEQVITASVLQNDTRCLPVTVSHAEYPGKHASHGTVYSLDIVDLVQGKVDPTIFALPRSCDNL